MFLLNSITYHKHKPRKFPFFSLNVTISLLFRGRKRDEEGITASDDMMMMKSKKKKYF